MHSGKFIQDFSSASCRKATEDTWDLVKDSRYFATIGKSEFISSELPPSSFPSLPSVHVTSYKRLTWPSYEPLLSYSKHLSLELCVLSTRSRKCFPAVQPNRTTQTASCSQSENQGNFCGKLTFFFPENLKKAPELLFTCMTFQDELPTKNFSSCSIYYTLAKCD